MSERIDNRQVSPVLAVAWKAAMSQRMMGEDGSSPYLRSGQHHFGHLAKVPPPPPPDSPPARPRLVVSMPPPLTALSANLSDKKEFRCKLCPHIFDSKSDLYLHVRAHVDSKPHKCQVCSKSFATTSYLAQHNRIHTGEKPYQCSYCDKKFKQLSHLQQHKRTHTGDKPYKCGHPGCDRAFTQLGNLQQHSRRHSLQAPHKCPHCYRVYGDHPSLQAHMTTHLGGRQSPISPRVPAPATAASTANQSYLMRHMGAHTALLDPPPLACPAPPQFTCSLCGARFGRERDLGDHVDQQHALRPRGSSLPANGLTGTRYVSADRLPLGRPHLALQQQGEGGQGRQGGQEEEEEPLCLVSKASLRRASQAGRLAPGSWTPSLQGLAHAPHPPSSHPGGGGGVPKITSVYSLQASNLPNISSKF